jgi:hypothetical protein
MPQAVLSLYILGSLQRQRRERSLTIFAEYKALRGLSRVTLTNVELAALAASMNNLRGYVEGGFPVIDMEALRSMGARLFNILITKKTRDLFLMATGESIGREEFLPLEIIAEDFEIAGWPWEYIYNSSDGKFIAQEFHPVSRSIFSMSARPPIPPTEGRVRILMILGVPPDDPYTTPTEEVKAIKEVFDTQLGMDNFTLEILPASDYKKLRAGFEQGQIDIVHYFGHAGFDYQRGEGFLSITRPGSTSFPIYAPDVARLLIASRVRLVFLNACKTAQASPTDNPGRSSVAASLLDAGIPAVIGTQFSLPDISAHTLSATIYNALVTGRPIGEAVRVGRNAMSFADEAAFVDWGIPVLYSTNPAQVIFPPRKGKPAWTASFDAAIAGDGASFVSKLGAEPGGSGRPSVVVERTRPADLNKKVKVALIDIDAKVGFLPDLAHLVNEAQTYYNFEVAYLPVPSGYVRTDLGDDPQTSVPRLERFMFPLLDELNVNFICGLTQNLIAGEAYYNLFASSLGKNNQVFVESTFDLRRYAQQAEIPFAKAVFRLCLGMLVACDRRWGLEYHRKTAGCLFDFCGHRDDIVLGLKKTKFDHERCRTKIKDTAQLEAIDRIFALPFAET